MKVFLTILAFLSIFYLSAQSGAFDTRTGEQVSATVWRSIPMDSLDLFGEETILDLALESNFKHLIKRKFDDEYQEAWIHYPLNDSILVKRKIRIKARGESRKQYCLFPPIKLNFNRSSLLVDNLKNPGKLKLVTHCKKNSVFTNYLFKEYLVYKLYELLTEISFKTRLLKIKYIDNGRKYKSFETFAFLIEEDDQLADRQKATLLSLQNLNQHQLQAQHMTMLAIFQYMIGNTDWSVPGPHNLKIIKMLDKDEPDPYPVPYDFDNTGLVNTEYSSPHKYTGLENVRQRLYYGPCLDKMEFLLILERFLEKEKDMYELVDTFPYLDKKNKSEFRDYLESFFISIKKPNALFDLFQRTCKK